MKVRAKPSHRWPDNTTPTLKENHEGELGTAGVAEDHWPDHLLFVILYHRGPATVASTSEQQTSRDDPADTSEKSQLSQP